ncbi:MAG: hypothetical protein ACRD0Q_09470 [Acidimicrobiales bacterium]
MSASEALERELQLDEDQIVWVDRAGLAWPASRAVTTVVAPPTASRGACYGLGFAEARNPLVAFTDSETVLDTGWRRAVEGAFARPEVAVVGGPVRPSPSPSPVTWAGFLVDYGAHSVAPFVSASGDVAGSNVAYRRTVLPPAPAPIWKSSVNADLRAGGTRPVLSTGMGVTSSRQYRWRDLIEGRARAGAVYGAQRSAGWSPPLRLVAATGCVALPALGFLRLEARLRGDDVMRARLLRTCPGVAVALLAWSAGEAAGYVSGRSEGCSVW